MRATWDTLSFAQFLKPNLRPYLLAPDEDANLVGMRLYGEGPFHRELKPATKIAKKSHFVIRCGDVIYNKLFAWKGSFGVVPQDLDGMFVSDKFPTYELDRSVVSEDFLRWYFRYPRLWEEARAKSTGSAALSKLTLNPPRFLDLALRAPKDVGDQQRIADWLEQIASKLKEARKIKASSDAEARVLPQVLISDVLSEYPASGTLGAVCRSKPRNGWSAKCDNAEDGTPVLALGAVTGFHYDPTAVKRTSEPVDSAADYWLKPGDLLMTRSNTPELVGHAAIYDGQPSPCIYPDLMMLIDLDETRVVKRFVWYWLQSTLVRQYIQDKAKGTSPTMKKISQGIVQRIPFPVGLSPAAQANAVEKLDRRLDIVGAAPRSSQDWQTKLNAVLTAAVCEAIR